MTATLSRSYTPWGVIGTLEIGGEKFKTLELPWLDNRTNISCIPEGVYNVRPYSSERYPEHYQVTRVKGRTNILIHQGNSTSDIQGCIAIGKDIELYQNKLWLTSSKVAMQELRNLIGRESFSFNISSYRPG